MGWIAKNSDCMNSHQENGREWKIFIFHLETICTFQMQSRNIWIEMHFQLEMIIFPLFLPFLWASQQTSRVESEQKSVRDFTLKVFLALVVVVFFVCSLPVFPSKMSRKTSTKIVKFKLFSRFYFNKKKLFAFHVFSFCFHFCLPIYRALFVYESARERAIMLRLNANPSVVILFSETLQVAEQRHGHEIQTKNYERKRKTHSILCFSREGETKFGWTIILSW